MRNTSGSLRERETTDFRQRQLQRQHFSTPFKLCTVAELPRNINSGNDIHYRLPPNFLETLYLVISRCRFAEDVKLTYNTGAIFGKRECQREAEKKIFIELLPTSVTVLGRK